MIKNKEKLIGKKTYHRKKQIFLLVTLITISFLLINMVSAVEYFQLKKNIGNNTIRINSQVTYEKDEYPNYIPDGTPLEVYVSYNAYPKNWNNQNPNNKVDYCWIEIDFIEAFATNSSRIIFMENFSNSYNYENVKYFMRLNLKEGFQTKMFCKFLSTPPQTLDLPVDFSIISPTFECRACQFYEWSKVELSISKAQTLGDFSVVIINQIKNLFVLNFEILLFLFWVIIIIVFLMSIGLIFSGVSWLYLFLMKVVNK